MTLHHWARLNRVEVGDLLRNGAAVMLPLGAVEQHGPHLPTGTDVLLAERIVERVAGDAVRDVLVLPALAFGLSGYHRHWGATITLEAETLHRVLRDIAASVELAGGRDFFIINGHGGNRGVCTTVSLSMSSRQFSVHALCYWDIASDLARTMFAADAGSMGHAGQAETGLVAAMFPDLVGRTADVAYEPVGPAVGRTALQRLGSTGISGNPAAWSVEDGKAFASEVVRRLAAMIDGADDAPGQAI